MKKFSYDGGEQETNYHRIQNGSPNCQNPKVTWKLLKRKWKKDK